MSDSESVFRCRTCNHKMSKHYWPDESPIQHYDFMRPNGFCMKKKCDCEGYKTTAEEKTFNVMAFVTVFVLIVVAGFIVTSLT